MFQPALLMVLMMSAAVTKPLVGLLFELLTLATPLPSTVVLACVVEMLISLLTAFVVINELFVPFTFKVFDTKRTSAPAESVVLPSTFKLTAFN